MPNVGILSQKVSNHILTETIYVLATMFGLPKALWSSRVRGDIERFLRETPDFPVPSAMRRFMAGELTGGEKPFHFRATGLKHIQAVLRAMDVIEALAARHDKSVMGKDFDKMGIPAQDDTKFHVEHPEVGVSGTSNPVAVAMMNLTGNSEFSSQIGDMAAGVAGLGSNPVSAALNESQADILTPPVDAPPKPRRGRPKGSKNRVKTEKVG